MYVKKDEGGLKFFESTLQCINIFSQLVQHIIIIIPTSTINLNIFMKLKCFFFQKNAPVFAGGGSAPCSLLYPGGTAGAHDKRVSC